MSIEPAIPSQTSAPADPQSGELMLRLIAAYKLIATVLLLALAFELLHLMHQDLSAVVQSWAEALRVDPDNRYLQMLLGKLDLLDGKRLEEMSAGTFLYAGLELLEGAGLWFRKRWAEYITIIFTAGFLPVEIYELLQHTTVPKLVVFAINIAVVVYLAFNLRRTRHKHLAA